MAQVRRDLEALRLLVLRPVAARSGTALSQVRNRLLGYREEDRLPPAPPAVQDVFRGIGETARAVLGLRIALDGPQDESDDSPATARSREELDAEDAVMDAGEAQEELTGLERPTTRAAVQVAVGSALAMVGGEFLSSQRWYWAVLTCWIVFLNTASTGEILVKGYRRLLGTVLGVLAGIVLAGVVGQHTWTAFALVLVLVFAMFYTAPLSYTLMSFFVTAALGLLYTLLHTYSLSVLVLRVEETALGAACGVIAAAFVLPVRTDRRTNDLLVTVLERLDEVTEAAVDQLSGGTPVELLDQARDLDQALADLRAATQPLTHPITPLRARRDTARYVVALLETCAYHARSLAATAELLPTHPSIAADPRLRRAGRLHRGQHRGDRRASGRRALRRRGRDRAEHRVAPGDGGPRNSAVRAGHRPGAAARAAAGRDPGGPGPAAARAGFGAEAVAHDPAFSRAGCLAFRGPWADRSPRRCPATRRRAACCSRM